MKPEIVLAISLITLALVCYTVAVAKAHRSRSASRPVLALLVVGVVVDVVATWIMVSAASGTLLTAHGILGFAGLAAMAVYMLLIAWHRRIGGDARTPDWLDLFGRAAYVLWLVAFAVGGAIAGMGGRPA